MLIAGTLTTALGIVGAAYAYTHMPVPAEPERVIASVDVLPYTETDSSRSGSGPASTAVSASATETLVEVPNVIGRQVAEAVQLVEAAGLTPSVPDGSEGTVQDQEPAAGSVVAASTRVNLIVAVTTPKVSNSGKPVVVCIDPGHQARSDTKKEPIGPDSSTMKPRVTGGVTGVETGIPEYEIALQVSMNLKQRLEAAGIRVVMTRTTNDVNISNAERAEIANKAGAALFVRMHANGNPDTGVAGVSTLYPSDARWTKSIQAKSRQAADLVQRAMLTATGAPNDGVHPRADLAGFNWAKVPAVLVECGYLSNPVEDRLLASPAYQDKVAMGIASGVLRYLGR